MACSRWYFNICRANRCDLVSNESFVFATHDGAIACRHECLRLSYFFLIPPEVENTSHILDHKWGAGVDSRWINTADSIVRRRANIAQLFIPQPIEHTLQFIHAQHDNSAYRCQHSHFDLSIYHFSQHTKLIQSLMIYTWVVSIGTHPMDSNASRQKHHNNCS